MAKVTPFFPSALSPRTLTGRLRTPRGRVDEDTCRGDAPETGAGSSASAAFALMHKNRKIILLILSKTCLPVIPNNV